MKELDKKLICKICGKECKSFHSLSCHISKYHKMNIKNYYDLYLKFENEELCLNEKCNNLCNFANIVYGYFKYCSRSCRNKSTEGRKISSVSTKSMWEDPNSSYHSKKRSDKLRKKFIDTWKDPNSIFRSEEYKKKRSESIKKLHKDPNSGYNTKEYRNKRSKIMKILTNDPYSSYNSLECRKKRSESIKRSYKNNPDLLKQRRDQLVYNRYKYKKLGKVTKQQMKLFKLCSFLLPYPILEYPCVGKNIDIAIPSLSLAIEYDEPYWHQDKNADDKRQKILEKEGWNFLRYEKLPDIKTFLKDINKVLKYV